nr:MOSC N-terminal beta barrel domain-containing protein [Acidovorax sp. SRB_24]
MAGTVARLFIHPVKSCAGIEVQQALLTDTGLEWDRAWMVVDAQGAFLTQRALPRMALVRPQMTAADLVLHAPGQAPLKVPLAATGLTAAVRVWNDTVAAWDMGDAAAQWFSGFLGQPCRLVRFDPAQRRLSSLEWTGGAEAPNQFADGFPLLVASTAGLDALNAQLAAAGQGAVGMERFRPNLVLGGVEAHDEDRVDLLHIDTGAGGAVQLQPVKPCVRCPIPDIDPASAERGTQVGDALRRYRQDARMGGAITFGMNAIVRRGAGQVLCVGQPLGAHYRFG